jgi:hypothetical protein
MSERGKSRENEGVRKRSVDAKTDQSHREVSRELIICHHKEFSDRCCEVDTLLVARLILRFTEQNKDRATIDR